MVHSGYHPLKDRPVRIVFGWCTVDIILLRIVPQDSVWMVHSGYHPLKDRQDSVWIVHSGYHPLKDRPLRIVFGWCTVDIILLRIVLSG